MIRLSDSDIIVGRRGIELFGPSTVTPPAPFSIDGGDSTTTVFDDALDGDLPHNDTLDGGDSNGN